MADKVVNTAYTVASVNGSQANGDWVRVGGHSFSVQTVAPASLGIIQLSNDKLNAVSANSGLGSAVTEITSRALWARGSVATDAGGPRSFEFSFVIMKED